MKWIIRKFAQWYSMQMWHILHIRLVYFIIISINISPLNQLRVWIRNDGKPQINPKLSLKPTIVCRIYHELSLAILHARNSTRARVSQAWFMWMSIPLTYTYMDCLLAVKMRGHKMAEIWEWLLMGSTADQYQDRPAGLLLWFVLVCRVYAA